VFLADRTSNLTSQGNGELSGKVADLAVRFAALREEAQRAALAEALWRARLGSALEAVAAAERAARTSALSAYRTLARRTIRPRRRNRATRMIDLVLARSGPIGQTVTIARSGVWGGEMHSFYGRLRQMLAILAYVRRGADPAANPETLFDQAWYLRQTPELVAGRVSPLVHYLTSEADYRRSPHPLLHSTFYAEANAEALAASGLTPLEHFMRVGAAEGRDPHPLFSIEHYVGQTRDLVESGSNPVMHYLQRGWRDRLAPHPLFAPDYYESQMEEPSAQPPLVHYLKQHGPGRRRPHPLFDPDAYLALYPDVAAGGDEPLTHYIVAGGTEGRIPSVWFDAPAYMRQRGSARPDERNPLVDYLQGGAWSLGEPWLDPATVEVCGMTPLERWARQERLSV